MMNIPPHIRELAVDASADARSVLADWFEDHSEAKTAARIRAGGLRAQLALACLLDAPKENQPYVVYFDGRPAFASCEVDLELSIRKEHDRGPDGRLFHTSRGFTSARLRIVGTMLHRSVHVRYPDEVECLARDSLIVMRMHSYSYTNDDSIRDAPVTVIDGPVVSLESVNRATGLFTSSR